MSTSPIEYTMNELLYSIALPTTVRISRDCKVANKALLKEGQHVTVIDTKVVQIIKGIDCNGKSFMINSCKELIADIVEEFYPTTEKEYTNLSNQINLVVVKKKFGYRSLICDIGECFSIKPNTYNNTHRQVSLVRDRDNQLVSLPLDIFLNKEFFSYAQIKEQRKLPVYLSSLQGKRVHFSSTLSKSSNMTVPLGIVQLASMTSVEVVTTVTIPTSSKYLRFETYSMNADIMGYTCETLPKHIALLGERHTDRFKSKVEEINFLIYYDCYEPHMYGYFVEENMYHLEDWGLQIAGNEGTIVQNALFTERNISVKHACKLKVHESILKKLSKHLLLKKSLGNVSTPNAEKTIRRFYQLRRTKSCPDKRELLPCAETDDSNDASGENESISTNDTVNKNVFLDTLFTNNTSMFTSNNHNNNLNTMKSEEVLTYEKVWENRDARNNVDQRSIPVPPKDDLIGWNILADVTTVDDLEAEYETIPAKIVPSINDTFVYKDNNPFRPMCTSNTNNNFNTNIPGYEAMKYDKLWGNMSDGSQAGISTKRGSIPIPCSDDIIRGNTIGVTTAEGYNIPQPNYQTIPDNETMKYDKLWGNMSDGSQAGISTKRGSIPIPCSDDIIRGNTIGGTTAEGNNIPQRNYQTIPDNNNNIVYKDTNPFRAMCTPNTNSNFNAIKMYEKMGAGDSLNTNNLPSQPDSSAYASAGNTTLYGMERITLEKENPLYVPVNDATAGYDNHKLRRTKKRDSRKVPRKCIYEDMGSFPPKPDGQ